MIHKSVNNIMLCRIYKKKSIKISVWKMLIQKALKMRDVLN